jgi:hypothetical protein
MCDHLAHITHKANAWIYSSVSRIAADMALNKCAAHRVCLAEGDCVCVWLLLVI